MRWGSPEEASNCHKMARRASRFRILLCLLITIPVFTLVMVFGVEWSYVERISRDDTDRQDPGADSSRKRTILSPNNRSPLDTQGREDNKLVDSQDVSEIIRANFLQKQAILNQSTSVIQSLSQQSLALSAKDKAALYRLLRERKLYELRMEKSMREIWWYVRDRVLMLTKGERVTEETIKSVREQYHLMRLHLSELKGLGGLDSPVQLNWDYWQRNISQEMTKLMEKRLHYLQNPPDCASAKKLVCEVAKTCGFGCQIHHVAYCFIMAYATKRTLILDSGNWRYSMDGWDVVFQPVSSTCTKPSGGKLHVVCIVLGGKFFVFEKFFVCEKPRSCCV